MVKDKGIKAKCQMCRAERKETAKFSHPCSDILLIKMNDWRTISYQRVKKSTLDCVAVSGMAFSCCQWPIKGEKEMGAFRLVEKDARGKR